MGDGDVIRLCAEAIDVGGAIAMVSAPEAGGVAVFLGTTRQERDGAGRELVALDYEAYEAMAILQMRRLAEEARGKWPVARAVILHRIGRVEVGEVSVLIGVSTPHRDQAFGACRFLIDSLKKDVAIWKKEFWGEGSGAWKDH